eukprot:gene1147-4366_t
MSDSTPLLSGMDTVQYADLSKTGHGHKKTGWVSSASIIVANMLGAGVLGLPYACSKMGWVGSAITLVCITMYSIYGGLILGWLRGDDDHIVTYGQLAEKVAKITNGGAFWKYFCQIFQDCASNGTNTSLPAQCNSDSCTEHGITNLSDTVWLLIAAAILYPLIHIRLLMMYSLGAFDNICLHRLFIIASTQGRHHSGKSHATALFPETLEDFVNGLTQMAFAYGGHVLMVDIQGVMERPQDWPKSIYLSQSFMFFNYAIVGFLGYSIYGEGVSTMITATLADNGLRIFVNVCLFAHVAIAYCINSTVVTRFFFEWIWPGVEKNPHMSKAAVQLRWGIVTTAIMGIVFLIGSIIPFFSDLMNVYSSLGIFSLSFFVPVIFWTRTTAKASPKSKIAFNIFLILVAVAGCGLGVWAAIRDIIHNWSEPFVSQNGMIDTACGYNVTHCDVQYGPTGTKHCINPPTPTPSVFCGSANNIRTLIALISVRRVWRVPPVLVHTLGYSSASTSYNLCCYSRSRSNHSCCFGKCFCETGWLLCVVAAVIPAAEIRTCSTALASASVVSKPPESSSIKPTINPILCCQPQQLQLLSNHSTSFLQNYQHFLAHPSSNGLWYIRTRLEAFQLLPFLESKGRGTFCICTQLFISLLSFHHECQPERSKQLAYAE